MNHTDKFIIIIIIIIIIMRSTALDGAIGLDLMPQLTIWLHQGRLQPRFNYKLKLALASCVTVVPFYKNM